MDEKDIAVKIEHLKKKYRLGVIGGRSLSAELESWFAKKRGKEDPNIQIGNPLANVNASFWALDDINLIIKKGERLGIIGRNGAGKSTLLKMLTGILRPSNGDITFDGHPWQRNDLEHIGALIEMPPLYENLTAYENLKVRTTLLGIPDARISEDNAKEDLWVHF